MAETKSDLGTLQLEGRRVRLEWFTGKVVGNKKWAETHVSASGGGGVINNNGGVILPTRVSSQTVTMSEIWLQDDEGREEAIELADLGIAVREGHKVTAVWGQLEDRNYGAYWLIENHTTGQYLINEAALNAAAVQTDVRVKIALFLSAICAFVALVPAHGPAWLIFVPVITAIWIFQKVQQANEDKAVMKKHIGRMRSFFASANAAAPV